MNNEYIPDIPELEIGLDVNITLHKKVRVRTTAYTYENEQQDPDGGVYYELKFDSEALKKELQNQVILPQDASLYIDVNEQPKAASDLSGWDVVDLEVIPE